MGWGGKQTKRVTRRADAKGGCPRSSKPSQVAPGANKPPLDAVCPLRLAQRSLPCAVRRFPHRFVQANCPQGAFGQMGENREDQGGGAPWQAGHLDAARQRSIRGAMVARLHLFPTCLPPHKPDLASNKKDRVWLPQKRSCPRSPTPPTFLFTTAKKWNCLSLTRLQQMWSRAFPDAGAGDRCCASSRVVPSGLPEGVWCWFPPSNLSGNPCCCTGTLVKMEEYFTPPFFYQCT